MHQVARSISPFKLAIAIGAVACALLAGAANASADYGFITMYPGDTSMSVEADQSYGAYVDFNEPTAEDDNGPLQVDCDYPSGSFFDVGQTTVTCSASNYDDYQEEYIDIEVTDTTAPQLDTGNPSFGTYEATSSAGAVVNFDLPSASDIADPDPWVDCSPSPGETFPLGHTVVSCEAYDSESNYDFFDYGVDVVDTTAPVFGPGVPFVIANATGPTGAVVNYVVPKATDAVGGDRPVTCAPAPGTLFPLGTTAVTCTAKDASDNAATTKINVSVLKPDLADFAITKLKKSGKRKIAVTLAVPAAGEISLTALGPKSKIVALGKLTATQAGVASTTLRLNSTALKLLKKKKLKVTVSAVLTVPAGIAKTASAKLTLPKSGG